MRPGHLKQIPRVVPKTHPPAFIIEDWEIPHLIPWPEVNEMPFAGFIDDKGRIHFELNRWAWTPEFNWIKRLRWAFRPHLFLKEFFQRITENSFLKEERFFLAGFTGVFHGKEKKAVIHFLASRHADDPRVPQNHEVRRNIMDRLCREGLDSLLNYLETKVGETSPCVIPVEKMKKISWTVKSLTLLEKIKVFRRGLPVSLRMKPRIFIKSYTQATPEPSQTDKFNMEERSIMKEVSIG